MVACLLGIGGAMYGMHLLISVEYTYFLVPFDGRLDISPLLSGF